MVKAAHQLPLACAIALLSVSLLHAKDLAAYRVGDTAEEEVATTVPLNVIDSDATAARNQARQEREQMLKLRAEAIQMHQQAWSAESQILSIHLRNQYLTAMLAGVSVLALLALWGLVRHRHHASLLSSRALTTEIVPVEKGQPMLPANLAPYLAQTLRETVVQELAAQRRELLMVQEEAAMEIAAMIRRLDSAQAPVRERLHLYETRILELEKELAARNEENRELLKLKIEMLRRQLESERTHNRMNFN